MKRFTKAVEGYIKNNRLFLFITAAFLVAGVCIGAGVCVSVGQAQSGELAGFLTDFSQLTSQQAPQISAIFAGSLANTAELAFFLWLCGLTGLGLFMAPALVGLRGFMVGFTVAALIKNFASVGLLTCAVGILPQMLLVLPCLIVFAVSAMNNASFLHSQACAADKRKRFFAYSLVCSALIVVLLAGVLIESYVSPYLIRWSLSLLK